ncbi:MAG: hypothetical protein LBB81_03785 [Treponema sp.]|jgi:hypothetical protein|nr:hypothetical protein [Treponema sp.]
MKIRNEKLGIRNKLKIFFVLLCAIISVNIYAQEFGFDNDDDSDSGGKISAFTVTVGGEVSASVLVFVDDIYNGAEYVSLGDIFSGSLNFSAGTSFAEGVINLNIQTTEQPVSIDEAYIRAFFGSLEIEGGLRKLTWGKADSFGPLDVINPLDYSELTDLSDPMNLKIARPLIHASLRIGSFSKIEGVFVPYFEPLRYDTDGRWKPSQMKKLEEFPNLYKEQLRDQLIKGIKDRLGIDVTDVDITGVKVSEDRPSDISTLDYAQAGARFTTTIGPADIGLQYYYGRLTRPAVYVTYTDTNMEINAPPIPTPLPLAIPIPTVHYVYNPYHQIGIDWAQVLFGFNVRAEFAANITGDLSADDGSVLNPALFWSFGFDRDLFWGINLNLQCNETIRLMYDKIGNDPLSDIEAGTDMTSTQIIAALSKKFFRDELELRFAALWGIEDKDYLLMPALIWTRDTVSVELSAGIFGGNEDGQFGQYYNNNFVKVSLTYSF